jgi:hypothetical protein
MNVHMRFCNQSYGFEEQRLRNNCNCPIRRRIDGISTRSPGRQPYPVLVADGRCDSRWILDSGAYWPRSGPF